PDRPVRAVISIATHGRDLFHQRYRRFIALAEDRISSIEHIGLLSGKWHFGDEKLGSVRVRSGIGIGETAGLIKGQVRRDFVLEWLNGIRTGTRACGISALDHESRNDPMEDGAVVQRNAAFAGAAHWVLPLFRSVG